MAYDQAIADQICTKLVEGQSLRAICKEESMPGLSTVFEWLDSREDFRSKYARARELQAEVQVDEMQEIADDGQNDWMEKIGRDGQSLGWVVNGEAVQRSKIRLEQRRWYAEKLLPKKYGAKLAIGGADGLPPIKTMADEQLVARIKALQGKLNDGDAS
jgi:hypothetical protein